VRWERLATGADTLVILMGASRVDDLCRRLIDAGRDPRTAAAVVTEATRPLQRHVVATLAEVAGAAAAAHLGAPAVLVVGDVVAISEVLLAGPVAHPVKAAG
jgi:uroporphyrinogen III methyltransferase/synthase